MGSIVERQTKLIHEEISYLRTEINLIKTTNVELTKLLTRSQPGHDIRMVRSPLIDQERSGSDNRKNCK